MQQDIIRNLMQASVLELKASKMILDHELTGEICGKISESYENKDLRHEMESKADP